MARDFSGTAQYLTFADVAGHDWSLPWTVAAIVYTDTVVGDAQFISHGERGGASAGWRCGRSGDKILFEAASQWGQLGTATTAFSTGVWYGIAATRAAASTNIIYYRYVLSTSVFDSETINVFASGYTDGTSPGRLGGISNGAGLTIDLWDGGMARVAMWNTDLTQAQLETVFRGTAVPLSVNLISWWELSGTADPEQDHGTAGANAANVSTTFIANPPDIGNPFGVIAPVIAMQRQGGQMIGRRYV